MDHQNRLKILKNVKRLERDTQNFDEVFNKLVEIGMFNEYMKNEILTHPDKVKFFYEYVTTRGPDAFKQLLKALNETSNGHVATFLVDGQISCWKLTQKGYGSNELALDVEFPHDPDVVWEVKQGIDRFDINKEEVYQMGSKPKGLVLIINVRRFVNDTMDERKGSEHDIKRLTETFEQVGYEVIVKEGNLSAAEINKIVKEFAKRDEHSKCDSCIVVVMSHGTCHPTTTSTINFRGYDMITVNSDDIISQFHGHKCRALVGKPKLFFFQACRGNQLNFTVPRAVENERENRLVKNEANNDKENQELILNLGDLKINAHTQVNEPLETESAVGKNITHIHPLSENCSENQLITERSSENQVMNGNSSGNQLMTDGNLVKEAVSEGPTGDRVNIDADILIGYSTTPGYVSRRDESTGSWFIQVLCQMIAKHAWNKDISTILEYTDRVIQKKRDCGTVQTTEVANLLNKKLFIQPGIFHD